MNRTAKHSIITSLLKAKRPDLANAVAKITVAQGGQTHYDWMPKAVTMMRGLVKALIKDSRQDQIADTIAAVLKTVIPQSMQNKTLRELRAKLVAPKEGQASVTADATMTRQHFQLIADVCKELPSNVRKVVAEKFADKLAATNPGFKADRFLKACGV